MKMKQVKQRDRALGIILVTGVFSTAALAAPADFAGTYKVLKTDCAAFLFFVGDTNAEVHADANGISLGQIFWTGDAGPGDRPYYTAAYDFVTGSQKVGCLGDCYFLYNGSYSADGMEFHDVKLSASTYRATPVPAGETVFKLSGKKLVVTTTDNGQFKAGPMLTCEFEKTN